MTTEEEALPGRMSRALRPAGFDPEASSEGGAVLRIRAEGSSVVVRRNPSEELAAVTVQTHGHTTAAETLAAIARVRTAMYLALTVVLIEAGFRVMDDEANCELVVSDRPPA
ncbi:hypothetical protein [Streptacidiphilus sp. MAP12-16]|uniref:hypothetical protein n=1 Tax=Streptacidiphilus sp. MAP12-16 TaxID=3156300 RepID=UPI003516563B